jgi:hypothetical protein
MGCVVLSMMLSVFVMCTPAPLVPSLARQGTARLCGPSLGPAEQTLAAGGYQTHPVQRQVREPLAVIIINTGKCLSAPTNLWLMLCSEIIDVDCLLFNRETNRKCLSRSAL